MSPLLTLVKILACLYQSRRLKDEQLEREIVEIYEKEEQPKGDIFSQDKKLDNSIRETINWLLDQPKEEPIIKSMLMQRVMDFTKDATELNKSIEYGLEDYNGEERTRQVIYQHLKEIRSAREDNEFNKQFKDIVKDIYFGTPSKLGKEKWSALSELIETRINSAYLDSKDVALVDSVDTDNIDSFEAIIKRAKEESSEKGVIVTHLQGLNRALAPDYGLRRGKMVMTPALTNRGKSFNISHLLAAVGLYNNGKDKLRNKTKIPTVVLDSAEDSLELIIERLYKIIRVCKYNDLSVMTDNSFRITSVEYIAKTIIDVFVENNWFLKINRINPTEDNYFNLCDRVRKLEMSGHEVIVYIYDYLAMMDLKGCTGDTKGDKIHNLYTKTRAFMGVRGILWITPHQLSPEAKKLLRESDDNSELYFAKEVGGRSMTEATTKITNEVDFEITIHIAKTEDDKAYFTFYVGKVRGEGSPLSDRFGIYDIHPVLGLQHDYGKKNACRKSFKHRIDPETGESVEDWDYAGEQ